MARAVDLSDVETSAILSAVANGANLRIFGTHEWGLHFVFYATQDIKTLKDLYGKRFAISEMAITSRCHNGPYEERESRCRAASAASIGGQTAEFKALMAGNADATVGEENPEVDADPRLHMLFVVEDKLPKYLSQAMAAYPDTLQNKSAAMS